MRCMLCVCGCMQPANSENFGLLARRKVEGVEDPWRGERYGPWQGETGQLLFNRRAGGAGGEGGEVETGSNAFPLLVDSQSARGSCTPLVVQASVGACDTKALALLPACCWPSQAAEALLVASVPGLRRRAPCPSRRRMHPDVLEWLLFLNTHDEFTYYYSYGDKDTLQAAFQLAGKAAQFYQARVCGVGVGEVCVWVWWGVRGVGWGGWGGGGGGGGGKPQGDHSAASAQLMRACSRRCAAERAGSA